MVNVDKMIEDQVLEADKENNEEPDQFKARLSRQVKQILDSRLFSETESKVKRESQEAENIAKEAEQ